MRFRCAYGGWKPPGSARRMKEATDVPLPRTMRNGCNAWKTRPRRGLAPPGYMSRFHDVTDSVFYIFTRNQKERKKGSKSFLRFEVSRPARKRRHKRGGILSRIPPPVPPTARSAWAGGAASAAGSSGLVVREHPNDDKSSPVAVVLLLRYIVQRVKKSVRKHSHRTWYGILYPKEVRYEG